MDSRFNNPSMVKISQSLDISRRKEPVTFIPGPGQCIANFIEMMYKNMELEIHKILTVITKIQSLQKEVEIQ